MEGHSERGKKGDEMGGDGSKLNCSSGGEMQHMVRKMKREWKRAEGTKYEEDESQS